MLVEDAVRISDSRKNDLDFWAEMVQRRCKILVVVVIPITWTRLNLYTLDYTCVG